MDTPETVQITFTETRVVDDDRKGTFREERYEAGQTYDLNPRSADRWVKRSAAFFTSDEDAARAFGASRDVGNRPLDDTKVDEGGDGVKSVDYKSLSVAELRKIAEGRNLNTVGAKKKDDFIEILAAADKAPPKPDYSGFTDEEIRELLTKREVDLAIVGSREEGIAKLEAWDAENPAATPIDA